jgi:three-Cys-motif partner protein
MHKSFDSKVEFSADSNEQRLGAGRRAADHEFGSESTDLKLSLVEAYSCAFTKALRGKFAELWFIDAFAGTGERTECVPETRILGSVVSPAKVIHHRGSAKIAIDVEPPFDRLIFVEKKLRSVQALHALRDQHPDRDIKVIAGDANEQIPKLLRSVNWRRTRAILFLDPYGMTVDWKTLVAVAKTGAIDLWFLFSLSGLYRQAARCADGIDATKRAAITRAFGTSDWEKALYRPARGFFSESLPMERAVNIRGLEDWVRRRLETIFPAVLPPLALKREKGPQLFSLFFAAANPSPVATALATRIANHILKPAFHPTVGDKRAGLKPPRKVVGASLVPESGVDGRMAGGLNGAEERAPDSDSRPAGRVGDRA